MLIDTPPVSAFLDATVIGRCTDGIILVIAADSTRHGTVLRARDEIEEAEVPVIGAVLNRRTFPVPGPLYHRL